MHLLNPLSQKGLEWRGGAIGNAEWAGAKLCDVLKVKFIKRKYLKKPSSFLEYYVDIKKCRLRAGGYVLPVKSHF